MEKSFKQFQLDLANKKIKMKNSKFDPIVESFSYTLITENNILFHKIFYNLFGYSHLSYQRERFTIT